MTNSEWISNKLKRCYEKFEEYQELNDVDKGYFDMLVALLWIEGETCLSNQYLAERFNYGVSTIEKKHRRFERLHLIEREIIRYHDEFNQWKTTRKITLDPFFKTRMIELIHGLPNTKKMDVEEQLEDVLEESEEAMPEVSSNASHKKWNYGKKRW